MMASENNGVLAGRRAVVTGAGRGLGRSIALALAAAGADVALTARTAGDLEPLAAEIEAHGRRSLSEPADVTDPVQVARLAEQVGAAWGGVDILVNNAGTAASHKFLNHPDDLWHQMLLVNLTSVYYVTKAILPLLIGTGGGRIVNIASTAARVGDRYVAAYTAAKHGVLGLTRALAVELLPHNITVNAVCPGFLDTPLTQASIQNIVARTGLSEAEARAALEQISPQKRLIQPEEVAAAVVFLCQESSKGITGQAINVDGGGVMS
jgi:NAD(P)-dependent dehydrogenase (short-subunit alcohol dehydrogenase family)